MQVINTVAEMLALRWSAGESVGLVPTMGYLHDGHLSLAHAARQECDRVVVSIFVNPTQFGPREDLSRYPRDLPRDLALLDQANVDYVFTPTAEDVYPSGFASYIDPIGPLVERLEGATRPGHFRGVATVVAKLFQLVRPQRAYFGQKDAQQAAVIRRLVADLHFGLTLRILPTVREADGLAMSSRNAYLSPEERQAATILYKALTEARRQVDAGEPNTDALRVTLARVIASEPRAHLDYADVCDPNTMLPLPRIEPGQPVLLALAARVGPARLIDNFLRHPDRIWDGDTRSQS
ncbi:MAG TPA: pantoate--beta-alanine ligase [Ktedonobacterales bacterium]|nr:pantoate--beta-alanine ligase [Ktedonobacterales bacterium]